MRESPFCLQILSRGDPNTFKTSHREQGPPEAEPGGHHPKQTAKLCRLAWASTGQALVFAHEIQPRLQG